MMGLSTTMNAEHLISKYVEIRDYLDAQDKAHEERCKQYREALLAISDALLNLLNQQGGDNIKTPAGTAYKTEMLSTKVVDAETFLNYVFENNLRHLITAAASKTAVKEFTEQYQCLPPGVETTSFIKCNIRRS
jgi:hypothetical protein